MPEGDTIFRAAEENRGGRIVLTTQELVAVCFSAPIVRVIARGALTRDPLLKTLGPDLLDPACDLARARENLRSEPRRPIGDGIMQQRLVAGIGNVYKSESLFLCRIDPFAEARTLDDATLDRLLLEARTLLGRNVGGEPRRTRFAMSGPRSWVYMRAREPCLVCGVPIAMQRQGDAPRSTYYCPRCQGVGDRKA